MTEKTIDSEPGHTLLRRPRVWQFLFALLLIVCLCAAGVMLQMQRDLHKTLLAQATVTAQLSTSVLEQKQRVEALSDQLSALRQTLSSSLHTQNAPAAYVKSVALSFVQYITLAAEYLSTQQDVTHALFFLKQAQSLLRIGALPADFKQLATVLGADITRLESMGALNMEALYTDLRSLLFLVDHLPDFFSQPLTQKNQLVAESPVRYRAWSWSAVKDHFFSLFEIRHFSPIDLLSPNEIFYLRRYLRVLLMNAYFELRVGDTPSFLKDMHAFHDVLLHYYGDSSAHELLVLTDKVLQEHLPMEWPDLSSEKQMAFDVLYHFLHS